MSAYAIMPEGQFVSIGSFPCKAVDNHPCLSPPSAAHYQRKRLVSNENAESQQDRQNPSSFAGIRGVADAGGGRLARIFHSLSHCYDHPPAGGSSDGGSQG